MARREELQEAQWALVEPLLPKPPRRADDGAQPAMTQDSVKML